MSILACGMCGGVIEASLVASVMSAVPILTNILNRIRLARHKRKIVRELHNLSKRTYISQFAR